MTSMNSLTEIGTVIGDRARLAMLVALMDTRALTAGELSRVAGVSAGTTSAHLARLEAAGLLRVVRQGRHRYASLASPDVARLLESMMIVAEGPGRARPVRLQVGPRDDQLRRARSCYDHLAGRLGVAILEHLDAVAGIAWLEEGKGVLTPSGLDALERLGLRAQAAGCVEGVASLPCLGCLDWSERRPHLRGRLGRLLLETLVERQWLRRRPGSRAVEITGDGARVLSGWLGSERWRRVTEDS